MRRSIPILWLWLTLPVALAASGCSDDAPTKSCIEDNPIVSEADTTGDQVFSICASPSPGSSMPDPTACDASTLAAVERECDEDGSPCAGTVIVSRSAALCIAGEEADLTTLEGPYVELTYHYGFKRPIWNVYTVTSVTDDGAQSGGNYAIDAASGELLGTFGWSETP